ncbi:MAG: hypothetical protein QXJ14_03545 [Candidatus Aenigmatarchaeota archaeon]
MERYSKFSTNNAYYYLNYGIHICETKIEENIENFDVIVLESGVDNYNELNYLSLYNFIQYKLIMEENERLKNPRPIFLVDIPLKEIFKRRIFAFLDAYSSIDKGYSYLLPSSDEFSNENDIYFFKSFQHTVYRSAVAAHKIEEFIIPEIIKRIKHKPRILIDYGAAHKDIEIYLNKKEPRKYIIKNHQEVHPYDLCDNNYLNKVCEFRHKNSIQPSIDAEKRIIERKRDYHNFEKIIYEI